MTHGENINDSPSSFGLRCLPIVQSAKSSGPVLLFLPVLCKSEQGVAQDKHVRERVIYSTVETLGSW